MYHWNSLIIKLLVFWKLILYAFLGNISINLIDLWMSNYVFLQQNFNKKINYFKLYNFCRSLCVCPSFEAVHMKIFYFISHFPSSLKWAVCFPPLADTCITSYVEWYKVSFKLIIYDQLDLFPLVHFFFYRERIQLID